MSRNISFYYNESGFRNILKSDKLANIEQEIMMQKLSQIKAEFLQQFGFAGQFELKAVTTNNKRGRITYRIVAADKKTGATLKKNSGWLGKFI